MKTSKLVVSLLVLVSMVLGVASTSFAVSDRKIKKEAAKITIKAFRGYEVYDISNIQIKNIVKNTRKDGVQFVVLEITCQSEEHGHCIGAIYMIYTAKGKIAKWTQNVASIDRKHLVLRSLAEFKALVKYLGDETAFMIVSLK